VGPAVRAAQLKDNGEFQWVQHWPSAVDAGCSTDMPEWETQGSCFENYWKGTL